MLLCFAAATTFWFLNAMNKQHTTTLNYDVDFIYDQNKYVEVEKLPASVAINVNGLGWNLLKINLGIKTSPLHIPLENPAEVRRIASSSLSGLISDQLSDLQLNYVLTDTLFLHLDERATRSFSLAVDTTSIHMGEGYEMISKPEIIPDSVYMTGPKSVLDSIGSQVPIKLEQNEITDSFDGNISVPQFRHITAVEPAYVQVRFNVIRLVESSVMVPIQLINSRNDSIRLFPPAVRVNYRVSEDSSTMVTPDNFQVIADMNRMTEDSVIRPELNDFPDFLRHWWIDSVDVRIIPNE